MIFFPNYLLNNFKIVYNSCAHLKEYFVAAPKNLLIVAHDVFFLFLAERSAALCPQALSSGQAHPTFDNFIVCVF
jgi:hypothetical protein